MLGDIVPDPKPPPFEPIENVMLKVDGARYVCGCGATVFTQTGPTRYVCNGCQSHYEGTRGREGN